MLFVIQCGEIRWKWTGCEPLRDDAEKYGRALQARDDIIVRHMRCTCWVTEATHTQDILLSLEMVVTQMRLDVTLRVPCLFRSDLKCISVCISLCLSEELFCIFVNDVRKCAAEGMCCSTCNVSSIRNRVSGTNTA
jgi:hypothetical protein